MSPPGPQTLDTRLMRFRSRAGEENAVALGEDLLAAGRHSEAQEVAVNALKAKPEDADLLLLEGRARFGASDLLGAQAALLKAARVAPNRKEVFRTLGEVLLKRGDPDRAVKVLERAKALDPGDRAIQLLCERAQRLSQVASTAGAQEAAKQARESFEPPPPQAGSERTVVRPDLTEQLRSMTHEVDAAGATDSGTFEEVSTTGMQVLHESDEDEGPTGMYGAAELAQLAEIRTAPEPAPAAGVAPKRAVARTLTFGSPGAPGGKPAAAAPAVPWAKPAATAPAAPSRPLAAQPARPAQPAQPVKAQPAAAKPPFAKAEPPAQPSAPPAQRTPPPPAASVLSAKPAPSAPAPFAEPAAPDPFPAAAPDPIASMLEPSPASASSAYGLPPLEPAYEPESAPSFEPAWAPSDEGPAPEVPPDVVVGGSDREDVDEVLAMMREVGLFEPPTGEGGAWATRKEAAESRGGIRIGLWLGIAWGVALGLAGGGYYGWLRWTEHKHQRALALVEQAEAEANGGDHADLVDAERHLREARELFAQDRTGPALLLFVHAQRALEDGAFDAGFLRPTIARAEQVHAEPAYLNAARAVLAAAEGGHETARQKIDEAQTARPRDGAILYLRGRLEQRLGGDDALEHLEAALQAEPHLVAASIALAEARYDEGNAEEALRLIDGVIAGDGEHLRARLWRAFMTSDEEEPAAAFTAVERLQATLQQHGAPTDQVIYRLTRARLLRRQGHSDRAGEEVDQALRAGASEPRLLALVAQEARRAGRLPQSEHAARGAVHGAPSNTDFRKLLAEVQIARHNGRAALTTLAELPSDDPDVLAMRARAALMLGSEEALRTAAEGLDAFVTANEDASVEVKALRIRMHTALGEAQAMMPVARALTQEAPGDPIASLALGEAALRTFDARAAQEALQQATTAAPDDAEGHYFLGRAHRMAGDAEGAEASFRRALELLPEHTDARLALGGLLLDQGKFAEADTLYNELARRAGVAAGGQAINVAGKLGRVEALIGLGRLDDAQVQLEGLRAEARESASARVTAARLSLARGRAGEALTALRELATAEGAAPSLVALYGDALLAANQTEPAGEQYTRALGMDSALPEALIGQAELAVRSEQEDDALRILAQLRTALTVRIRPPSMRARMLVLEGRAHLQEGRSGVEAARTSLRSATEIAAAPAEAWFWLGEALAAENSPEARQAYEAYLERAPSGSYASRARRAVSSRR